jgi:V/A-type H+-transporting ATPase subunit D
MAKVKNTKNELKAQRDALKRYQRYLPTLQLKQQQLQAEVRQAEARLLESSKREAALLLACERWVGLFADGIDFAPWVRVTALRVEPQNVAGVTIPVLRTVDIARTAPSLLTSPSWHDDALDLLAEILRLFCERRVLQEQMRLLGEELRITNQRVNLFERVKIPECKDGIRKIRIALGDAMTLDVARGKIAKGRASEQETSR